MLLAILPADSWQSTATVQELPAVQAAGNPVEYLLPTLRVMEEAGLIVRQVVRRTSEVRSTPLGKRLIAAAGARSGLYAELVHFLFYTLWERQLLIGTPISGWSWIYQATCRLLWEERPTVRSASAQAVTLSQRLQGVDPTFTVGVHRNSPNAVRIWLMALDPPFLHEDGRQWHAQGRSWCTPELLLLALDGLYRTRQIPIGSPLLLDAAASTELAALCLVEPSDIELLLDVTYTTFPAVRHHSGEWGRAVVLTQPISMEDLL
jgi:hypothetical protein